MPKSRPADVSDTPTSLTLDDMAMVDAYFRSNMNGKRAWQELHPDAQDDSAAVSASRWLSKDNVRAEIKRRLTEKAMSVDEALARLADMARAEHYPFIKFADDGFVYFDFSHPDAKAHMHLIKRMETKRERRLEGHGKDAEEWEGEWVKVELHDAQAALMAVLKMHGKFVDKVDHTGDVAITVRYEDRKPASARD